MVWYKVRSNYKLAGTAMCKSRLGAVLGLERAVWSQRFEQSTLLETTPALTLLPKTILHTVVPASLLVIVTPYLWIY